jgi:DNA-directed RNA polymerase subunit L
MNIQNIVKENNKMDFDIHGVHRYIPNSLRRTILSDIETMVFKGFPHTESNIHIKENGTRFHNEYLKQRLECIPIHLGKQANFDSYITRFHYVLDVENTSTEKIIVTTKDLKLYDNEGKKFRSDNVLPKYTYEDVDYHIPICYLYPRISQNDPVEKISLKIKLTKGTAGENASWNVVSKCVFYNKENDAEVEKRARSITDPSKKKDFMLLDAQRICLEDTFHMCIESVGIYNCPTIIKKACTILKDKLQNIHDVVESTEFTGIHDLVIPNTHLIYLHKLNEYYVVRLENEDYTIGTLIEYGLSQQSNVVTVSFFKEHSHDKHSYIKVKTSSIDDDGFKNMLKKSIQDIISIYVNIDNQI